MTHMETNEAFLRVAGIFFSYDLIHKIIETPINIVKFLKYRHKKSNWIMKGLLRSIKYRDKLYKQLKMSHPDSAEHNTCYINFKTYNTILKKSIREAKRLHYEQLFDKCKFNVANTWKTIIEITSRQNISTQFPTCFKQNNKTY